MKSQTKFVLRLEPLTGSCFRLVIRHAASKKLVAFVGFSEQVGTQRFRYLNRAEIAYWQNKGSFHITTGVNRIFGSVIL